MAETQSSRPISPGLWRIAEWVRDGVVPTLSEARSLKSRMREFCKSGSVGALGSNPQGYPTGDCLIFQRSASAAPAAQAPAS